MVVRKITENAKNPRFKQFVGKYSCIGGTVIADSEKDAIEFEREYYETDIVEKEAES